MPGVALCTRKRPKLWMVEPKMSPVLFNLWLIRAPSFPKSIAEISILSLSIDMGCFTLGAAAAITTTGGSAGMEPTKSKNSLR